MFTRALPTLCFLSLELALVVRAQETTTTTDTTGSGRTTPFGGVVRLPLAAIGFILYGLSSLIIWLHLFRNRRVRRATRGTKSLLSFGICLGVGLTAMTLGFIVRMAKSQQPPSAKIGTYIIMTMFLLLSPCAFLACDYILLGRLINSYDRSIVQRCLIISPDRNLARWFVISDCLTLWLQGAGGSVSAIKDGPEIIMKIGPAVALVGLVLQLISFSVFSLILIVFVHRLRNEFPSVWSQRTTPLSHINPFSTSTIPDKRPLFKILCFSIIGIFIRSIFRIVEYANQDYNSTLRTVEIYFYLLDALPLLLVMVPYCWVWPARVLEPMRNGTEFEAMQLESKSDEGY